MDQQSDHSVPGAQQALVQSKRRGALEMAAAMGISGSIGILAIRSRLDPLPLVFWRCLIGFATISLVRLLRREPLLNVERKSLLLVIVGGVALTANWLLLFAAFPRASVSIATVVYSTQPFALVLLGAVFLDERPTRQQIAAIAIAFLGGAMIVVDDRPELSESMAPGIFLALGAGGCYALVALLGKKLKGIAPLQITQIQTAVGALVLAVPAAHYPLPGSPSSWTILLTIGTFHTALMFTLQYSALQKLPTHAVGALYFIYPLVAIILDGTILGTRLDARQWTGVAIVLAAVAVVIFSSAARPQRGCTKRKSEKSLRARSRP